MSDDEAPHVVARALLDTATAATDRTLLAWAVGAMHARHCLDLADYRRTGDPSVLGAQCAGGASSELDYDLDGKGFVGLVRATGHRFTVRWRDVAVVLDRSVHLSDLVNEQRELLRQRVELTRWGDELFARWQRGDRDSPEHDEHDRQWSALERRCAESAERTWRACYPQHQQIALFA